MDCIIEQMFSFCFYTIHLPPAEEGEFLLYYVKNNDGQVMVSNRIFETVLYNLFLAEDIFKS